MSIPTAAYGGTRFSQLGSQTPNLNRLVAEVLQGWPEHADFLELRFGVSELTAISEDIARLVNILAGSEISRYVADYRWMCGNFLREDIAFRKTDRYRLSTFADAYAQIYSDQEYMSRYLRGILLSQVLWTNQAMAISVYVDRFLTLAPERSHFLEVGLGHGLYTYFASLQGRIATLEGWDVSESSLRVSESALQRLGIAKTVELRQQNIMDSPMGGELFDLIVLSEVLEHLDRPELALDNLFQSLRPGGLLFLNVPVNSPAPDHIYLWRAPEEVEMLVTSRGYTLVETALAPVTGHTIESARRRRVTINSLIIAQRPA